MAEKTEKRVTKAEQVRGFVRRYRNLKNAETLILNKTLALGFKKPLAKIYIKKAYEVLDAAE